MRILKRIPSALRSLVSLFAVSITLAGAGTLGYPLRQQVDQTGHASSEPNRLAGEKSPYLQQHAYNPVDWYPWGEEAFAKATSENKPIFLSVGYSTCHWCHVMESESFSNPEIATLLNRHFVSIKVDREERPDIDKIYMTFIQSNTGRGGWPMSVFMTPDRRPFFGGTYFPPERRWQRPGFKEILLKISDQWKENRSTLLTSAAKITEQLQELAKTNTGGGTALQDKWLSETFAWYRRAYNGKLGGFGGAPKFPRPVNFNFLFRYHARSHEEPALEMATNTLRQMAAGGIRDHVGGGFHRYSTDRKWFLPHFEKMLYDQAQITVAYLEAFQITGDESFAEVAREILKYVLRDLKDSHAGFFSAEDADSPISREQPKEKAEGAFYVWTQDELEHLLGEASELFETYYGVKSEGNIAQDPFGEFDGQNLLSIVTTKRALRVEFGKTEDEVDELLEIGRQKLLEARQHRPRPMRDDKVLTAWNGLMISAFSKAFQTLGERSYLLAARQAAEFIEKHLFDSGTKTLTRRFRDGEAAIGGMLDDYAFFIQGLLDLYEASLEDKWLEWAIDLQDTQNGLFRDKEGGGFFKTTGKDSSLIVRLKEDYDGSEPAPNSIVALNLLRLGQMTGNVDWTTMGEETIVSFARRLEAAPYSMPQMMVALDFSIGKPLQILLAGDRENEDTLAMLREVRKRFVPRKVVLLADGGPLHQRLAKAVPTLEHLRRIDGKTTAYVCRDFICELPTNSSAVLAQILEKATAATNERLEK
jgi:uncharacterized protein YyaL (SSP411 family)